MGGVPEARAAAAVSVRPGLMLGLATVGFAVTFWAWALLSPLGATLREELSLTAFQQSLLVAVPVIVGSLGRIPVGALTDRVGARVMFPFVSALTILPVLYLGHLADSYAKVLVGGFFLGLGGTTFAIGIPFVNAWYPPARRGLALGIFGTGMGGTAISAFTTVQLADAYGRSFPFNLVAVVLAVYAVVSYLLLRRFGGPGSERLSAAIGLFGMFNVPFVYWSVNLWRTLHPKTSVVPTLPVDMGLPLWFSTVAFLGLTTVLLALRTRLERRKAELDALHLAVDERE